MKKLFVIFISAISIGAIAVNPTNEEKTSEEFSATINSVNNPSYLSTGSAYSSSVSEVGADAPMNSPMRKAGGGGPGAVDPTQPAQNDPQNPQFSPVGDAVLPLLLMAMAFGAVVYLRRRKAVV